MGRMGTRAKKINIGRRRNRRIKKKNMGQVRLGRMGTQEQPSGRE
jgi:hypothetical protein